MKANTRQGLKVESAGKEQFAGGGTLACAKQWAKGKVKQTVGLAMSLIVGIAAVVAFSPRPAPEFPVTHVLPDRLLINGLAAAGNRLVAVGELGQVLVSDNQGESWDGAAVKPQRGSTLTQTLFLNDKIGIAVGHDSWILRTEDGGRNWGEIHFDAQHSDPLLNLAAGQDGQVFAVGSFGALMTSSDSGKSWQPVKAGLGDSHLYGLAAGTGHRLMLVGERGLIARSGDGGATWEKLAAIYDGSFFGVAYLGGDEWIAYGMRGNVYRTRDFGKSWSKSETGIDASFFGAVLLADQRIVLVGQGGAVVASNDRGASFQVIRPGGRQSLATVIEDGRGGLLTGGESGVQKEALQGLASIAKP